MAVRVRFAPSPTGPLHIGVRTALYNYLFAKKHNGSFVLRIEDTDQHRFVEGAEAYIQTALSWLGVLPDESPTQNGRFGPYKQSSRKSFYADAIARLLSTKKAYYAFDSVEELEQERKKAEVDGETFIYNWKNRKTLKNSLALSQEETISLLEKGTPFVVRFISFSEGDESQLEINDIVRGKIEVSPSLLDDKILMKQDGMPTYHLANVVDDHFMEISHVIRGEEWLPSLPLHVLLYRAFGWESPLFAHVPLILKPSGKGKLSKRDGATFGFPVFPLQWDEDTLGFKESGYLPEALINYLALLGWNPGGEQELFTKEELIASFSLEGITKSGGRFDPDRCVWFNQQYLHKTPPETLVAALDKELKTRGIEKGVIPLDSVVSLIQDRLCLLTDIWKEVDFFFVAPTAYDDSAVKKQWKSETNTILSDLVPLLENADINNQEEFRESVKKWSEEKNIGLGKVMAPLRIALVGSLRGPDVFAICNLLGANECVSRIQKVLSRITL